VLLEPFFPLLIAITPRRQIGSRRAVPLSPEALEDRYGFPPKEMYQTQLFEADLQALVGLAFPVVRGHSSAASRQRRVCSQLGVTLSPEEVVFPFTRPEDGSLQPDKRRAFFFPGRGYR